MPTPHELSQWTPAQLPDLPGVPAGLTLEARAKFLWLPNRLGWKLRSKRYARTKSVEFGLLPFLVPRDRVAVDVGASVGLVTYFLARLAPTVIAFEPSPQPLKILTRVVDPNVTVCPVGVSSASGEAELDVFATKHGWTMNGASLSPSHARSVQSVKVPIKTVALDDVELGDVGFLKIDVEGHEDAVLAGAQQTIARCRPIIMIENEFSHVKEGIDTVFAMLWEAGYHIYGIRDHILTDVRSFDVQAFQAATQSDRARYLQNFIAIPKG